MKLFQTEKDKMYERIAKGFMFKYRCNIEIRKEEKNYNTIDIVIYSFEETLKEFAEKYKNFPKVAEYIANEFMEKGQLDTAYGIYRVVSPKKASLLEKMTRKITANSISDTIKEIITH